MHGRLCLPLLLLLAFAAPSLCNPTIDGSSSPSPPTSDFAPANLSALTPEPELLAQVFSTDIVVELPDPSMLQQSAHLQWEQLLNSSDASSFLLCTEHRYVREKICEACCGRRRILQAFFSLCEEWWKFSLSALSHQVFVSHQRTKDHRIFPGLCPNPTPHGAPLDLMQGLRERGRDAVGLPSPPDAAPLRALQPHLLRGHWHGGHCGQCHARLFALCPLCHAHSHGLQGECPFLPCLPIAPTESGVNILDFIDAR